MKKITLRNEFLEPIEPASTITEPTSFIVLFSDNEEDDAFAEVNITLDGFYITANNISEEQKSAVCGYAREAFENVIESEKEHKDWLSTLNSLAGNTMY